MRSEKEIRKAILKELAKHGINPKTEWGGSGHQKIIWEHNGQVRMKVIAASPSCRFALQNGISDVRKILRRDGVI
jgi:hypothetical protein